MTGAKVREKACPQSGGDSHGVSSGGTEAFELDRRLERSSGWLWKGQATRGPEGGGGGPPGGRAAEWEACCRGEHINAGPAQRMAVGCEGGGLAQDTSCRGTHRTLGLWGQ